MNEIYNLHCSLNVVKITEWTAMGRKEHVESLKVIKNAHNTIVGQPQALQEMCTNATVGKPRNGYNTSIGQPHALQEMHTVQYSTVQYSTNLLTLWS
jgi:hypothetical protein